MNARRIQCALILLAASPCMAADWRGALLDGSQVEVDPSTLKAWQIDASGQRHPLWDGVHRLADGSVVIVRDGTAVPSEGMLQAWSQPSQPPTSSLDASPCNALVLRVCGDDFRCSLSDPCRLANELVDLEKEELRRGPEFKRHGASAEQCREALGNAFFVPCE